MWVSLITTATLLDWSSLLDQRLKGFSVINNFNIIFKSKTIDSNEDEKRNLDKFFNIFKILVAFGSVIVHFGFQFEDFDKSSIDNKIHLINYLSTLIARTFFYITYALSGVSSARWFFRALKRSVSWPKLVIRFYFGRLAVIAPLYYVIIIFVNFYLKYLTTDSMKDPLAERECRESVVSNMLFISNFSRPQRMVKFYGMGLNLI